VIPIGKLGNQMLHRIRRRGNATSTEALLWCAFVPLVGKEGWTAEPRPLW
jgi:protein-L-isoaspartate(D-aspartate) O-methyltransferase